MATEFDAIFEEFSTELDAIREVATGSTSGSAKSRIAAGNGSTLLLAAVFEEFVRQQVKAAYREHAKFPQHFRTLATNLAATIWRRAFDKMGRTSLEVFETDTTLAQTSFNSIVNFCLKKDSTSDVAEFIAHNENNMRTGQMNALFNSIGIKTVSQKISTDARMIEFLGCEDAGEAEQQLPASIEAFFKRRNEIAHAVQMNSSSGPTDLENDIALFRQVGDSLTRHLVAFFEERVATAAELAAMKVKRPSRPRPIKKAATVEQVSNASTISDASPVEGKS